MKPTKNQYYCPACGEHKMHFETEKEAYSFIEYESEIILAEKGYCPIRAYKCPACRKWHITSRALSPEDATECIVDKEEMEESRKLLRLVVLNSRTVALNLSRKVSTLGNILKRKRVDWEVVNRLTNEVIEIFERVWKTPYRYLYNVRQQWREFEELSHVLIWRKNQTVA